MPFRSKAQKGWMFANEPAMAKRWAAHTPNINSLPEKVGGKKQKQHYNVIHKPKVKK